MDFYALIEEWSDPDESIVFFRELPGCFVTTLTTHEAIQKAPGAIADYLRWLKQNNTFFLEEEVASINVVIKEILRAKTFGPRFESDLSAPTDQEIDNALNVAATARAMLIELYDEVSPHLRSKALKADEWSLTQHLRHILEAEAYYIACLSEQLPEATPPTTESDLPLKLFENAMDYEVFLRRLTAEQRTRIYIHGEAEWTAAKTLRRMTKHLREHYPWMQEIVGQLSTHSH